MKVVAKTHCGKVRPINEDRYLVPEEGDSIVLVADGMGGHKAGEVASETAAQTIRACAVKMHGREISIKTALKWVRQANQIIYRMANEKPECMGMGTTMTLLWEGEQRILIGHVGDSRAYYITEAGITRITKDHSLVESMVDHGDITADEARRHPGRNLITRALGRDTNAACDGYIRPMEQGDFILLCTDGLVNTVTDQEMLFEIVHGGDLDTCLDRLLHISKSQGAPDNVTAVLMQKL